MSISKLTERNAVLSALKECDELGRERFLAKYGFRHARTYLLLHDGKYYDSKAIAGVACKYQFGTPLRSRDFAGGLSTVKPALNKLGFVVVADEIDEISSSLAEEVPIEAWEGAKKPVLVNRFERSPEARSECIEHHGAICKICGFDFSKTYGDEFCGFIHVHHIVPLSKVNSRYKIDPKKDLVPLCPNCHAVVHYGGEVKSIESIQQMLVTRKQSNH